MDVVELVIELCELLSWQAGPADTLAVHTASTLHPSELLVRGSVVAEGYIATRISTSGKAAPGARDARSCLSISSSSPRFLWTQLRSPACKRGGRRGARATSLSAGIRLWLRKQN